MEKELLRFFKKVALLFHILLDDVTLHIFEKVLQIYLYFAEV